MSPSLSGGQGLAVGASLESSNGTYSLVMQGDGNLVEYVTANAMTVASWDTGTAGSGATHAQMLTDGNLVLYDAEGNDKWSTRTQGNPGATFVLDDDGTMVVLDQNGTELWKAAPNTLLGGQGLASGTYLGTPGGAFSLVMQGDGNLVLYTKVLGIASWASGTVGSGATTAQMLTDGNFVLYDAEGNEKWSTGTQGNPGARLVLDDEGAAVVVAPDGTWLWTAPRMLGSLVTAFIAFDSSASVLVCWSTDGVHWQPNVDFGQSSKYAPALALFNARLHVAFVANDPSNAVLVCSSDDGWNWTANTSTGQSSKCQPSLAVFNGRLYTAFVANDGSNAVLVSSSPDGVNWTPSTSTGQSSWNGPSLAVFNGRLYMAFVANDESNALLVCSSADGVNWTANTSTGQSSTGAPSLAVFNGRLYMAFVANDTSNAVLVCSSDDGMNWTANTSTGQSSDGGPSLAVFDGRLQVAFAAASNVGGSAVLVCSSDDGVNWTPNISTGQTSDFSTPSLAAYTLALGYAYPTYKVLTLVYAPPGTNGGKGASTVTYDSGSSTGTRTTTARSFKNDDSVSADRSLGGESGPSIGGSESWTAATTTTDSKSLAIDKSASYTITVKGPPADGIDHGQDLFYLWLNPALPMAVDPANNITWGIGVTGDTMLVPYAYASWLEDPSTMPDGVREALTQAGLTEADFAQILALDPFVADPDAAMDPNRFLPTGQSFPYEPPSTPDGTPATTTYTQKNTTTKTSSTGTESAYSVRTDVSAGLESVLSANLTSTDTLRWTDTSTSEQDLSTTESATVTVGGPAYGYTGATDLLVYWDTVFKSFFFKFTDGVPDVTGTLVDANGAATQGHPVELHIEGQVFRTFTDSRGEYRFFGAPAHSKGKVVVGALEAPVVSGADTPAPLLRLAEAPG